MPTVWFPYDAMGRSPAGFVWDATGGRFGPFEGQVFVADQYEAAVFRVDLERVKGHWQGACLRFREGLACGALRLAWTKGGALIVGETDRGWGSKGPVTEGLQRIDWSGETPFEVLTMRLSRDGSGFRLRFTAEADRATAADPASYSMESFTYAATHRASSTAPTWTWSRHGCTRTYIETWSSRMRAVRALRQRCPRRAPRPAHPDVFTLVRSWGASALQRNWNLRWGSDARRPSGA